jgi:hypothetical protein
LHTRLYNDPRQAPRIYGRSSNPLRMNRLQILQYNVRKSKKVIEPLLADPQTQSYDVIALQEP